MMSSLFHDLGQMAVNSAVYEDAGSLSGTTHLAMGS
jgi:hypothetical protein